MKQSAGRGRAKNVLRFAALVVSLLTLTTSTTFANHNFRIYNRGDHSIFEVHISGIDQRNWGPDLLASDETIDPGEYKNFNIVQGCEEDVKIVYHYTNRVTRDFDTCQYDLKAQY